MTALEIILLLIGVVFLIGSFFIAEKLSPSEVSRMAELSDKEIEKILDKRLAAADQRIEDTIDSAVDGSMDRVERSLDKETNEKIMAIHEYSDTVIDEMSKTRDEITFLYSMLNDRYSEMTETAGNLRELIEQADEAKRVQSAVEAYEIRAEEKSIERSAAETVETAESESPSALELFGNEGTAESSGEGNHNRRIMELYEQGMDAVAIARELSLGVGEVQLVLGLSTREKGNQP